MSRPSRGSGGVDPRGSLRASARCNIWTRAAFSIRVCWRCTACRCRPAISRGWSRAASRSSHVPAATAIRGPGLRPRGVLRIRRAGRGRHRQLGRARQTERLRRVGDHACASRRRYRRQPCSTVRRVRGARLGFESATARSSPKRARLLAVTIPRGTDDVEEYLVSGSSPSRYGGSSDSRSSIVG